MAKSPRWTAVFSGSDERSEELAKSLGLVNYIAYGVYEPTGFFEGARADRALIEKGTYVPTDLLENIYGTVAKLYGGKVLWVSATELQ